MALGIGDRLPSFSLEDQNGDLRTPASVQGRWLVLFFYPKDDTPGCTAEACSFRDNAESFAALDAEVWGCLLYTSPSPRDKRQSRMPSSA